MYTAVRPFQPLGRPADTSSPFSLPPNNLLTSPVTSEDEAPPTPTPYRPPLDEVLETSDDDSDVNVALSDTGASDSDSINNCETYERTPRAYTPRVSRRRKLERVISSLRSVGWSFQDFIEAWVEESGPLENARYSSLRKRRDIIERAIQYTRERRVS